MRTEKHENLSDLVDRCLSGEQDAWNDLVKRFNPLMYRVLGSYNFKDYEREDVCQSAWIKVLRNLHQLQNVNRLPGWLMVVTRNEALRYLEKDGRSTPVGDQWFFESQSDPVSVEHLVTHRMYVQDVISVVHQLPDAERTLLGLLTEEPPRLYSEISASLGIPRGSIGPNRARILAQLRRRMSAQGLLS